MCLTTTAMVQGEVILAEGASVAGPLYTRTRLCCLDCRAQDNLTLCSRCQWPGAATRGQGDFCCDGAYSVCGPACEEGEWHRAECGVLAEAAEVPSIDPGQESCHLYPCLLPLRLLLLRRSDPASWRVLDTFMDHDEQRRLKDSQSWRLHEASVLQFLH